MDFERPDLRLPSRPGDPTTRAPRPCYASSSISPSIYRRATIRGSSRVSGNTMPSLSMTPHDEIQVLIARGRCIRRPDDRADIHYSIS